MATLTIRNLDEAVKQKLRIQGAKNNRSMEAEAREILKKALAIPEEAERGLGSMIHDIAAPYGGIDLELPDRRKDSSNKRLPQFEDDE